MDMDVTSPNDAFSGSVDDLPTVGNKKSLLVLFIVDTTRTMEGQPISQVNVAIQELLGQLRKFATDQGVNLKLSIVSFTSGVKWDLEPTDIQICYDIEKIQTRPGLTMYGEVYYDLRKRLIRGDLIENGGRIAAPLLIFLTDGAPDDDYSNQLEELEKNPYFAGANRAVVLLGDAVNDASAQKAASDFAGASGQILYSSTYTSIVGNITLATMKGIKGERGNNNGEHKTPVPGVEPPAPEGEPPIPGVEPPDPGQVPDPGVDPVPIPGLDPSEGVDPFFAGNSFMDPVFSINNDPQGTSGGVDAPIDNPFGIG